MEREQERLVWAAAYRYLGSGVTLEDVEEAWVTFYSEGVERSRLSYRPGGPDFATYALHVCFKRECIRRGEEIRKRKRGSISITAAVAEEGLSDNELLDSAAGPHALLEQQSLIQAVVDFLNAGNLPAQQRRAFELKHFEEMSNEEIAEELGAPVGTIRVWVHRGAVKVQEFLTQKGWAN
ncbi:RNA polymerase sigma factor [Capsulimonas corticalis]|nr:sigma-70 family RNA polymerase sigma factor [Capsulimonas corticalis]